MRSGKLANAYSVEDVRRFARRRLPRAVFEVVDGGIGDDVTVRRNRASFERIALRPRALVEVSKVDTGTTILGDPVAMPFMLAPCSFARMCHSSAEPAAARAAGRAGTVFAVANGASQRPETIAAAATGPLWFQIYMSPHHEENVALVDRVERAGYRTLCVTVDTAIKPYRERDLRNGMTPLRPSPQLLMTGLSRPLWSRDFVLGNDGAGMRKIVGKVKAKAGLGTQAPTESAMASAFESYTNFNDAISHIKSVTAEDISWLRERWKGPLVVKGILRGDEVPTLVDLGVDGIVVSNHGGRNLDGAPATIDVLAEVVAAAGGRAEVFLDSGVRRGADVVKALALGAQAVLIGRPYLYGLAAAGEAGVDKVVELLHNEVIRAMSLLGATSVDEIDASLIDVGR